MDITEAEVISILCKLMPYVLPKTESVKHTLCEPEPPQKNWFEILFTRSTKEKTLVLVNRWIDK
jgi:hypothetical protein